MSDQWDEINRGTVALGEAMAREGISGSAHLLELRLMDRGYEIRPIVRLHYAPLPLYGWGILLPGKGTFARQVAELQVRFRQLWRAIRKLA